MKTESKVQADSEEKQDLPICGFRKKLGGNRLELAGDFPDAQDCLAAFLVLETAEVLTGVKPANLIRISNHRQIGGLNLHELWHSFGPSLINSNRLQVLPLLEGRLGMLLLFFSPDLLQGRLADPEVSHFLVQLGYPDCPDLLTMLAELKRRFRQASDLPHEIGLFLGYPLKDVAGFMKRNQLPCTGCRFWRIYGDPSPSLALSDRIAASRRDMAERLRLSHDPKALLRPHPKPSNPDMHRKEFSYVHFDHRR